LNLRGQTATFNVVAGQHYEMDIWVRCSNSPNSPSVGRCQANDYIAFDVNDSNFDGCSSFFALTGQWQELHCDVTVTQSAIGVGMDAYLNLSTGAGALYYDIDAATFYGPF
jgi:hypothetical protein